MKQLMAQMDRQVLDSLLSKTLSSCERDFFTLREALEQENLTELSRTVHSLKGTALLFRCDEFIKSLEMLEQEGIKLRSQSDFLQRLEQAYLSCRATVRQGGVSHLL